MAVAHIEYFSQSLKKSSALVVLFPDDAALPRPWSVLYLLHGLSDNQTVWTRQTSLERYLRGLPMMVVMPDGGRGWYTNAVDGGAAYEDDLIKDVVRLVDRTFPVKTERAGRAIGGLSMGGFGAVKLGLKHPQLFASVHSHSGALGVVHDESEHKDLRPELRKIFGPQSIGGPEDPFALIEKIDHGVLPALRIDCGTDDGLLKQNRAFHQRLTALHIAHEYQEFPGGHDWGYWDQHIGAAIGFHARQMKIVAGG